MVFLLRIRDGRFSQFLATDNRRGSSLGDVLGRSLVRSGCLRNFFLRRQGIPGKEFRENLLCLRKEDEVGGERKEEEKTIQQLNNTITLFFYSACLFSLFRFLSEPFSSSDSIPLFGFCFLSSSNPLLFCGFVFSFLFL
jgi:hypothetical protein